MNPQNQPIQPQQNQSQVVGGGQPFNNGQPLNQQQIQQARTQLGMTEPNQPITQTQQVSMTAEQRMRDLGYNLDGTPIPQTQDTTQGQKSSIFQSSQFPETQLDKGQINGTLMEGEKVPFGESFVGKALPAAGFAVGEALGGPVGAAVGTAAGKAVQGVIGTILGDEEPKNLGDIIQTLGKEEITSLGVSLAGLGLSKAFSWATEQLPQTLYKSALDQSTADLKKEITEQAPNLAKQLIDKGVVGSDNTILTQALTALNDSEGKINSIVSGEVGSKTIGTEPIANSLDNLIKQYKNVLGDDGATAMESIKNNILNKGNEISVEDALQLKRDIYNTLSNSAFNVDASLSQKSEALRIVANKLMNAIGDTSPELDSLSKQQQMWIRTAQAIEGKLVKAGRGNIIGISDTILGGASLASGGIAPALAGVGKRVIESTPVKTGIGFGLDRLGQLISKIPIGTAIKAGTVGMLQ